MTTQTRLRDSRAGYMQSLDVLRTAKACGVHVQRPHMLGPLRTSCRRANPSACWIRTAEETQHVTDGERRPHTERIISQAWEAASNHPLCGHASRLRAAIAAEGRNRHHECNRTASARGLARHQRARQLLHRNGTHLRHDDGRTRGGAPTEPEAGRRASRSGEPAPRPLYHMNQRCSLSPT